MDNKALKTKNKRSKHALERNDVLKLEPDELQAGLLNREEIEMSEERVLNTVLRWTQHRQQERQQHLSSLMRAVQLSLVPRKTLVEKARVEPLVSTPRALLQIIEELAEDPQPSVLQSHASLLVMGGLKDVSSNSTVIYSLPNGRWKPAASLPAPRIHAGAAVIDHLVYLVGGREGIHDMETVFVYNAATDCWSIGPPMITPRISPGVVELTGRLYAVGGRDKNYSSCISVETLDPREGVWRSLAPMASPRHRLGVAVLDGMIYAIGGYYRYESQNGTERYDPVANTWESVEAMSELKGDVGVATLNDTIYAVGGSDGFSALRSVERYRVKSGWESLPPMKKGVRNAAATAHGDRLYLVGGYDGSKRLTTVSVFDPSTNVWSQLPAALPASRLNAAAVVLPWPL